jgi:hypothetical protein
MAFLHFRLKQNKNRFAPLMLHLVTPLMGQRVRGRGRLRGVQFGQPAEVLGGMPEVEDQLRAFEVTSQHRL